MDKKENIEKIKMLFKTKNGKISIVFFVLAIAVAVTGSIAACAILFIIGCVFLFKGESVTRDPNAVAAYKFKPTKKVGKVFYIDDVNKKWHLPRCKESKSVYDYSDLLDYELIEDGNTVTSGSLGRAVAGGLVFGGLGAVVGGMTGKQKATCSKLQIKITTKDIQHPALYVSLLDYEVKKDSDTYKAAIKDAQEILSILQIIKTTNK